MPATKAPPIIEQPFNTVNPLLNVQLPLFPESMIHHKVPISRDRVIVSFVNGQPVRRYGVSRSRRVLSPQILLKRFNLVRDCLEFTLGVPCRERDAVLAIIRYWAYYGEVYPKQSSVCTDQHISKATYWRAIRRLRDLGLLRVVNRFIIRPHAQISNLYRLDQLVKVIARYLAEHGVAFREKWLRPYLIMPGSIFWPDILGGPGSSGCCSPPN